MGFSDTQTRQLRAKLDGKHVKSRKANGTTLHYVEGWHVIAEANRVFGFDAWDRRTLTTRCIWTGMNDKHYATAYTARVRIRVRAGDITIVREGSGTGEGRALTPGEAHEIALKSAETDATKRALATFGNRFGLALYDRAQTGVRPQNQGDNRDKVRQRPLGASLRRRQEPRRIRSPKPLSKPSGGPWPKPQTSRACSRSGKQNLATVRLLHQHLKHRGGRTRTWLWTWSRISRPAPSPSFHNKSRKGPQRQMVTRRQGRQEHARLRGGQKDPVEGAPEIRCKSAVPHLRAGTVPCPSCTLRSAERNWAQGQ